MVGFTPTASDPRILRHVTALSADYQVTTMGTGVGLPGTVGHVQLPALDHLPRNPLGLAALATRQYRAAYSHIPIANAIKALAPPSDSFDVVIANDLVTLPAALSISQGKPVIADMHEYEPRQFEDLWQWRLALKGFYTHWCNEALPRSRSVITVSKAIAHEYQRQFGVAPTVVMNAARYSDRRPHETDGTIRLVHSGQAIPSRRLEVMIEAAKDLPHVSLDLYLTASPHAVGYLRELRTRASRCSNVQVLAPVAMHDLGDAIADYDVGLTVLYPSSFNIRHALPNKFFDFVQARLGIVVGPSPEMAAIVTQHGLGTVTADFSPSAVRSTLAELTPAAVDEWKFASDRAAHTLSAERQAVIYRKVVDEALAS